MRTGRGLKKTGRAARITALMLAAALAASAALGAGLYYRGEDAAPTAYAEYDAMSMAGTEIEKTSDAVTVEGTGMYAYDFRESRNYGIAAVSSFGYEDCIDFEAYAGIRLTVKKGYVAVEPYLHSSAFSEKCDITLYKVSKDADKKLKSVRNVKYGTEKKIKGSFTDGLYKVTAVFSYQDEIDVEVSGWLYVKDKKIQTCRVNRGKASDGITQADIWNHVLRNADPEDYLSNEGLTYPTSGTGRNCNHVSEWEEISDGIILHDDWSDEMKVFAFVEYLSKNIAYDDYRAGRPDNKSRATLAGNFSDDKYFTLENNVGICWDYANILAIMCRRHGIPCTSVECETHTFNAVWLNNGWVGIDITKTCRFTCKSKDTSKENWKPSSFSYGGYGGYGKVTEDWTEGYNIWTKEKGLGTVTYDDWVKTQTQK